MKRHLYFDPLLSVLIAGFTCIIVAAFSVTFVPWDFVETIVAEVFAPQTGLVVATASIAAWLGKDQVLSFIARVAQRRVDRYDKVAR